MTPVLIVTGTDTDVGKTVVTAALAALASERGLRVAVVKPVQTGTGAREAGDLEEVWRLSGVDDLHEFARLAQPLAPGTAAHRAGVELPTVDEMADRISRLTERDLVLVEGAGGLLVELDSQGGTLADLAQRLGASFLVVVRAGLGTLNSAALTCEAIRARGLSCVGVAIGAWPPFPELADRCNLEDLPRYTQVQLLGRLPDGATRLDQADFLEVSREGLGSEWLDEILNQGRQQRG
jgi:dethiobiotin synthetase